MLINHEPGPADMMAEASLRRATVSQDAGRKGQHPRWRRGPRHPYRFALESLALFLAVVEEGGRCCDAAKRIGTSASTISNHLSAIEKELGGDLIMQRHGRGAAVTGLGHRVAVHAKTILDAVQAMLDECSVIDSTEVSPGEAVTLSFVHRLAERGVLLPVEKLMQHPERPSGVRRVERYLRALIRSGRLREDEQGRVVIVHDDVAT